MGDLNFKMDDDGTLSIDVFHLLHELPENRHIELAESLSCSDVIIGHVMDQILDGCTENGFSGSCSTGYDEPLQKYRLKIAKAANDLAKKEIDILERRLKEMKALKIEYQDKYFELYNRDLSL